jgi:hypothetical protein
VKEYDVLYKERILELTSSMFDTTKDGLQDSFRTYVHDCIQYLKQQEMYKEQDKKEEEIIPINGDQFIFAPKKIDVLVKKNKKNMFLIHGKT